MRPKVYADFQNADIRGGVRLNTAGTLEDVEKLGLALTDGSVLLLSDDELETEGVVELSYEEQIWVARIEWSKLDT